MSAKTIQQLDPVTGTMSPTADVLPVQQADGTTRKATLTQLAAGMAESYPKGYLGAAYLAATTAALAGSADVGISVTINPTTSRRYRVTFQAFSIVQTGAGLVQIQIWHQTLNQLVALQVSNAATAGGNGGIVMCTPFLTPGTHTFRARIFTNAVSCQVVTSTGAETFITVEDIGSV